MFLRVLLRDRLRHPVLVLETPGQAYEEGKFLEGCLTKASGDYLQLMNDHC